MPEYLVGFTNTTKGDYEIKRYKTADFVGQGAAGSTILGSGITNILAVDAIMEGAMPFVCCRNVCNTIRMGSGVMTMPFWTSKKYVKVKSASADAQDLAENMGKALMQTDEYALTAGIAKELIRDCSGDIVASVLREMGGCMEATLDRVCISGLLATSSATEATGAAADALKLLASARGKVGTAGFVANSAIVHPEFVASMITTYIPAYNTTSQSILDGSGNITKFIGLNIGESAIEGSGTEVFGWGATNENGAIVFDRDRAGSLGIREDMVVEEFDNVTKVMLNPLIRSSFCWTSATDGTKTGRTNKEAVVRVTRNA
jgi:hypothetical protein